MHALVVEARDHLVDEALGEREQRDLGEAEVEADPQERPISDPPPVEAEKQWIKIQVIDDETGNPVPGIPLELLLPGRPAKEYKSDANNGRISISDLSAGTCDILKMKDDEAWEVVSAS